MKTLLLILLSSLSLAESSSLLISGRQVLVDLSEQTVELKNPTQLIDPPVFANGDQWVGVETRKKSDKEFLILKIWTGSKGTSTIVQIFYWVVFEHNGETLKEVARLPVQIRKWINESEYEETKPEKVEIKIKSGKALFFLDGKLYAP